MVTDDDALAEVTEGPTDAGRAYGATVYVDMSTVSPQASRALAERAAARARDGGRTGLGSVPAVESGTLAIIAAGQPEAFRRVDPSWVSSGAG